MARSDDVRAEVASPYSRDGGWAVAGCGPLAVAFLPRICEFILNLK